MNTESMNPAVVFVQCAFCLSEIPENVAPSEFARISVGLTSNGDLVIWCVRHDAPIGMFEQGTIDASMKEVVSNPCSHCGEIHDRDKEKTH